MSQIQWTQAALDDLAGIQEYIARDSIYYAEKFVDDIFEAAERLELFPESGRMVPERNNPNLREIIFGMYRIIYRLKDHSVCIVTVIHGKRLLPDIDWN